MNGFFKEKKNYIYGLILFVFISAVLLTCGEDFFKEYSPQEKEEIKQEILSEIDDSTLCRELYGENEERCGGVFSENFEVEFAKLNKYQKDFFIAQGLNQDMEDMGVGLYLCNSRCLFLEDVSEVMTEFGFQDIANLWNVFSENTYIDWKKITKEVQEYDDWDTTKLIEMLYAQYPLKEFDDAFFSLNQDNYMTKTLSQYARANIDQYNYGRVDERHLFR